MFPHRTLANINPFLLFKGPVSPPFGMRSDRYYQKNKRRQTIVSTLVSVETESKKKRRIAYLRRLDIEARVWIASLHGCLFLGTMNVEIEVISDEECRYAGASRWQRPC